MKLALLDDYHGMALELADWGRLAPRLEVTAFGRHIADRDELAAALLPFDAVMLMRERTLFPREVIERLPNLRLLITSGMWNAAIDVEAAGERGIQVCGTRSLGHLTAELTLGLMISLARRIPFEERALREGRWQAGIGESLHGRTLGILGLGKLGSQVCAHARMLGMEVIAWSRNLTAEAAAAAGARLVSRDELFAGSDIITIHLRLSERTRGLVGTAELARMKPTAFLINTSRGPIVDEAALVEALRQRRIAGAAIDVYATEPLPADAPIRGLDNVILLPHIGYVTRGNFRLFYGDALEDVEAFLNGRVLRPLNTLPERS